MSKDLDLIADYWVYDQDKNTEVSGSEDVEEGASEEDVDEGDQEQEGEVNPEPPTNPQVEL